MCDDNQTEAVEFVLLGFRELHNFKILLFTLFLLTYIAIMTGNLIIILVVSTSTHLNVPMFYFLKHLALTDVIFTTSIIPFMLHVILVGERTMSVYACIIQLHVVGVTGSAQCFLLAVMSFDRYMAIRKPLNYTLIMTPRLCLLLVVGCWLSLLTLVSIELFFIYQFKFCGRNYIDHFFCDFAPLVKLTISDISIVKFTDIFLIISLMFIPFVFIIITYILIFFSIMKIPSVTGRRMFFSTCSSHLSSVCTYYVTMIIIYAVPSGAESENKFRTLLYFLLTPLMNPIIYSWRNKEIRGALRKLPTIVFLNW
ncbi:olfactory receptor 11A1-like [Pelobates fuscus]|uniref:olfactory receptor 11A1-like n=1 Tax=Pelobates fuscus TaxID=191477 RepID=UPI002FE4368A